MKRIIFGKEAREKLKAGSDAVANAVKVTLGPLGRNVIISEYHGAEPSATKDGVSVARSIQLEDPIENVGAQIIKGVARKTVDDAGDGTTTATVLAQSMINEGLVAISGTANPMDVKRGMDKSVAIVVNHIKSISKKIDGDVEKIKNVATISANNDSEIGDLIASAFAKIGETGVIDIEDSSTAETTIRVVDGMQIDKGYISKYFVTNPEKMEVVMEDALVIVTDHDITLSKEIIPILEKAIPTGKPIFIVCSDLTQEGLSFITMNKLQGGLKISAIKPSSAYRAEALSDIATLTGATVISESIGIKLENASLSHLGSCGKIVSTELTTSFIDGKGSAEAIKVRQDEVTALLANAKLDFDIDRLKRRLARLSGGVAIMSVGASTDIEMNEKKDRVDDAVRATRSAIEEGIVAGGASCLLSCMNVLEATEFLNEDEMLGRGVILKAMEAPLRQILSNCGIDSKADSIVEEIKSGRSIGYNAKTMNHEDLFASGVIDPAKVVRVALENACSIAGVIITCECLDAEIHRKGPMI
jgi:chaperonin GroEL